MVFKSRFKLGYPNRCTRPNHPRLIQQTNHFFSDITILCKFFLCKAHKGIKEIPLKRARLNLQLKKMIEFFFSVSSSKLTHISLKRSTLFSKKNFPILFFIYHRSRLQKVHQKKCWNFLFLFSFLLGWWVIFNLF